jgi:hypothetical protein
LYQDIKKKIMKFGVKINTEFLIKTDDTLYDHLRLHVLSLISDQNNKSHSFYWESTFQWTSLLSLDPIGQVVLEKIKMWKVYRSRIQNVDNSSYDHLSQMSERQKKKKEHIMAGHPVLSKYRPFVLCISKWNSPTLY